MSGYEMANMWHTYSDSSQVEMSHLRPLRQQAIISTTAHPCQVYP